MRRVALIVLSVGIATGWTSCGPQRPPELPKVVYVPVKEFVTLPKELTVDCLDVPKRKNSTGEAVRLANARKDSTDECTKRMREIRALQPKP